MARVSETPSVGRRYGSGHSSLCRKQMDAVPVGSQYGTEDDIIRTLDRIVTHSSNCIIFGQVTEDQIEGYNKLSAFQKLIIHSPEEFNLWMMKDNEWKAERILRVKREIQFGRYVECLNGESQKQINRFDVFKALEERKDGQDQ